MPGFFSRRDVMKTVAAMMAALVAPSGNVGADQPSGDTLPAKLVEIEKRLGGRVGASVLDVRTGKRWSHRADERFPLNSTFKAFACAGILARVDAGQEDLQRRVVFGEDDLVAYSLVAEKRVGGEGMSLSGLCEAAMTMSDNTAANMVLEALGGPQGFTAFMRSIGDGETRLDRWETELNEGKPGDPRDTTTPAAAARSLRAFVLGDVLSEGSRRQLREWLVGNKVGGPLLRASLPEGWRIGDRTGAGGNGSRSIIAVIWPPERAPLVAAVYLTGTQASMEERNRAIVEIGGALVEAVAD